MVYLYCVEKACVSPCRFICIGVGGGSRSGKWTTNCQAICIGTSFKTENRNSPWVCVYMWRGTKRTGRGRSKQLIGAEQEKIALFLCVHLFEAFYDEVEIVVFKKLELKFVYAIQPCNFTSKNIYWGDNQKGSQRLHRAS